MHIKFFYIIPVFLQMRLDISEFPCCYYRSNAAEHFILVYPFFCGGHFTFALCWLCCNGHLAHVFCTYFRSLGELPTNGVELPNMLTLLNNTKLFFKSFVPVNIRALSYFCISYIFASTWWYHTLTFCQSGMQEIFCCYFNLCTWLLSEFVHPFLLTI